MFDHEVVRRKKSKGSWFNSAEEFIDTGRIL
jgi:hypothetical protein